MISPNIWGNKQKFQTTNQHCKSSSRGIAQNSLKLGMLEDLGSPVNEQKNMGSNTQLDFL